ncbi:Hypothetical predicted protein [Podarcis lilfordi]|uniref:Uncharacterized protein n=1 Tax=Podarcis lilfordi TaxID=74358 RepID=A0AA35KET5_9SAUR|nr:Hypothetical predicted protein [Podarcis lilfordi]
MKINIYIPICQKPVRAQATENYKHRIPVILFNSKDIEKRIRGGQLLKESHGLQDIMIGLITYHSWLLPERITNLRNGKRKRKRKKKLDKKQWSIRSQIGRNSMNKRVGGGETLRHLEDESGSILFINLLPKCLQRNGKTLEILDSFERNGAHRFLRRHGLEPRTMWSSGVQNYVEIAARGKRKLTLLLTLPSCP